MHKKNTPARTVHAMHKNVFSLFGFPQKVNYLEELIDFMSTKVEYAKTVRVIRTAVCGKQLKKSWNIKEQKSTMNAEENAEHLMNARTEFACSLRINEKASHANKTCNPVEYLTSMFFFSACLYR